MAEDLQSNLENYKLQLQQVDAALTSSPDDEELLKLKHDLLEVIDLTNDLIKAQVPDQPKVEDLSILPPQLLETNDTIATEPIKTDWKPKDRCLALWLEDGQYYEATIESIEGEEVSVMFDDYDDPVVTTGEFIKEIPKGHEKTSKIRKQPSSKQREYQKKKKLKKQIRFKQLEEEREVEKNKWLNFSSKTHKKGIQKKSIFASPDNAHGRVGIGTCGVSGRGMTGYQHAEKYKK